MVSSSSPVPRASRSHHERHSRRLAPEDPDKRLEVELIDIDGVRDSIRVGLKKTHDLDKVENFLRRRFREDPEWIPEDAKIVFYSKDKRLSENEIPSGLSSLRYQVLPEDDDGSLRVACSTHVHLDKEQIQQLSRQIEEGKTIGDLRKSISTLLKIDEPQRIVLSGHGGLRTGLLQGNSWEVRRTKEWLCREIFIDVVDTGNYVLLRGHNEEYVYHPPIADKKRHIDARGIVNWLRGRVLTCVHYRNKSRLKVDFDDICLMRKGRVLTKRSHIGLGKTVEFQLTRKIEDRFVEEEAWLIAPTQMCMVCCDDKRVSEMPTQITPACEHQPQTCKQCVGQWIASSLETMTWDRLKCPECPQLLRYPDVRAFASPEVFARYDDLATKAFVTDIRDFRWCLNPRCGSGQIHRADCPKVKCHACRASSCSYHNVPWHSGETCDQYDGRTRSQRKGERASEKKVKELTRPCPQCHRDVYKYTGCDHITCICGHEFCYICLAKYTHDRNHFLQCSHKPECRYFDNPPNYEGGRAFMPFLAPEMNQGRRERFGGAPPPLFMAPWQDGLFRPFGEAQRRPARRPAPPPPPPPPQQPPVAENVDPFVMFEDFVQRNQFEADENNARRDVDDDFLGGAAMFTLHNLWQRAR